MKTCGWTDRSPPLLSTVIVSIWIQWTKRSELTRGWLVWNKKYSISNKWNEIEPNKYSISNKRNEIEPNKGLWINFRGNGHFIMMVQFYSVCERPRIFVEISFCLLWFHQYFFNKVIHEVKCSSKCTCIDKITVHKFIYPWNMCFLLNPRKLMFTNTDETQTQKNLILWYRFFICYIKNVLCKKEMYMYSWF